MNISKLTSIGIISSALIAGAASASQVADLTTFTSGTPAKAAEVNANFTALKAAINDADSRLSAVESGKQNRITGECQPGMAVTSIDADGSVTCDEWRRSEGVARLVVPTLTPMSDPATCHFQYSFNGFRGTASVCWLGAQVYLPQGAEVTELSCEVIDSVPGDTRVTALFQRNDEGWITSNASQGNDGDSETITGTVPTNLQPLIVDNDYFAYRVRLRFDAGAAGSFDAIGGVPPSVRSCSVKYRQ
jgi:hypothetical protein